MKALSLFALALMGATALAQNDTAYTALRVVGKAKGEQTLDRVAEVRGRFGTPAPSVWKIVTVETMARGGIREFEVQRGKIISERAPTVRAGAPGGPLNLNQLNLDSEGAFTVANQEMQREGIAFSRVDYLLHSGTSGGTPVWTLELYEKGLGKVATLDISAENGNILGRHRRSENPAARRDDIRNDRDYVEVEPEYDRRDRDDPEYRGRVVVRDKREHSRPGEPFRGVGDFFNRLGKRFERRGVQLKRFFSGD